jgi:hypothetical protein
LKINLFSSYYTVENKRRQAEIDFCYQHNLRNPIIDGCYYFDKGRPTYQDFFKWMAEFPNDINILANSDIYFDETLALVNRLDHRTCYALTRWEERKGDIVEFDEAHKGTAKAMHSQDIWIFKGGPRVRGADFSLGQPGCDNKIAYLIMRAGYNVLNPSLSVHCIHRHANEEREYNLPKVLPPYKWIPKSKI